MKKLILPLLGVIISLSSCSDDNNEVAFYRMAYEKTVAVYKKDFTPTENSSQIQAGRPYQYEMDISQYPHFGETKTIIAYYVDGVRLNLTGYSAQWREEDKTCIWYASLDKLCTFTVKVYVYTVGDVKDEEDFILGEDGVPDSIPVEEPEPEEPGMFILTYDEFWGSEYENNPENYFCGLPYFDSKTSGRYIYRVTDFLRSEIEIIRDGIATKIYKVYADKDYGYLLIDNGIGEFL